MYFFMLFLGILGGICFGVQGPVNSALGKKTDVFESSLISFFCGSLISLLIALIFGNGDFLLLKNIRFWQILGGVYGVVNVCVTVAAIPVLGAAFTLTIIMLGQILAGSIIDLFGFFESPIKEINFFDIAGIFVVIIGIILIYFGSINKNEKPKNDDEKVDFNKEKSSFYNGKKNNGKIFLMIFLSLIAGILGAMQSPTNASLAKLIGNWEGTFVSFFVGTIILIPISLIAGKGKLKPLLHVEIKPWMCIGGLYGVLGIFLNLYTVQTLGTALLVLCSMVGQLFSGLIIDSFGLFQTKKIKVSFLRILGIIVIVFGIILKESF